MPLRPARLGAPAANDDDITVEVDLIHAVAKGTAKALARPRHGALAAAAR